ncbi:hypothetical protein ABZX39_33315 [Streptomyces collinus]|uniref:hypothetical protein n=1 Tax=Streptomyces collinus TaxID=42684 RepID=UPI0033B40E3A
MTCEDTDTTEVRLAWEIQLYEPFSRVWICRGYGRATTSAEPADIASAALAGHLIARPPRPGETFRAIARTDTKQEAVVTADQLPDTAWEPGPDVRQALPLYLRDALPAGI